MSSSIESVKMKEIKEDIPTSSRNYGNGSKTNTINSTSQMNSRSSNEVETMDLDNSNPTYSSGEIQKIVRDLKRYSEEDKNTMMNKETNPIENLSYEEYDELLDSIDNTNLKTEDAALLFTSIDDQSYFCRMMNRINCIIK